MKRKNGVRKTATETAAFAIEKARATKTLTFYKVSKLCEQNASPAHLESAPFKLPTNEQLATRKAKLNKRKVLSWLECCSRQESRMIVCTTTDDHTGAPVLHAKPDSHRIGFFDLPAEVRNKIAEYMLDLGHIRPTSKAYENWTHFRRVRTAPPLTCISPKISQRMVNLLERNVPTDMLMGAHATKWRPRTDSCYHPGLQFLATCSRAYNDYHSFLYSRNNFHLPPGMPMIWGPYFAALHSKHWLLIPSIVVYFGTLDFTPHAMVSIEYANRHMYNRLRAFWEQPEIDHWHRFLLQLERHLTRCWIAKLIWLRDNVKGKRVILVAKNRPPVVISTGSLSAALGSMTEQTTAGACGEIQFFLTGAWLEVFSRVEPVVHDAFDKHAVGTIPRHRRAIEVFKAWLAAEEELWNTEGACWMCGRSKPHTDYPYTVGRERSNRLGPGLGDLHRR